MIKPPTGQILFALGPDILIPTGKREFTEQQWGLGPGLVGGFTTKTLVVATFLQYNWGIGGWNGPDKPDANLGTFLYLIQLSLPDAWAVGTGPTLTYNHDLPKGNRWNVPVGPQVAKTVVLGKLPVKFELSAYYSVKHEDLFGQRWQFTLDVIPVIPSLVTAPAPRRRQTEHRRGRSIASNRWAKSPTVVSLPPRSRVPEGRQERAKQRRARITDKNVLQLLAARESGETRDHPHSLNPHT